MNGFRVVRFGTRPAIMLGNGLVVGKLLEAFLRPVVARAVHSKALKKTAAKQADTNGSLKRNWPIYFHAIHK